MKLAIKVSKEVKKNDFIAEKAKRSDLHIQITESHFMILQFIYVKPMESLCGYAQTPIARKMLHILLTVVCRELWQMLASWNSLTFEINKFSALKISSIFQNLKFLKATVLKTLKFHPLHQPLKSSASFWYSLSMSDLLYRPSQGQ